MKRRIYFTFKKSFLREQGLTKEDVEKGLAELARNFRKAFAPETIRTWEGKKYIRGADTDVKKDFNPSEPRDGSGRWTSSGGGIQADRIDLVNSSPTVIQGVGTLKFNSKNWKTVIDNEMDKLEKKLKNKPVNCKCLGKKVDSCDKYHIYIKNGYKRPFYDIKRHASYIPFIIPVLEHGITDKNKDRIDSKGRVSHEIVCRADIKNNRGETKRIGVSVIVREKRDSLNVMMLSVFRIIDKKNHLIKSCAKKALKGNWALNPLRKNYQVDAL